jgi:DNA-binding MarR family transcriptional regulator
MQHGLKGRQPGAAGRVKTSGSVSELESHLGYWLRFVSNHVSAQFAALVEAQGVSVSEWVALRHLFGQDESSAAQLMAALGMTKGAISKVLTRLEEKGLVARLAAGTDKRAQAIRLTKSGRALVPVLAALADQNDAAFFGHLLPAQREQLFAMMQEVVRRSQLKEIPVS